MYLYVSTGKCMNDTYICKGSSHSSWKINLNLFWYQNLNSMHVKNLQKVDKKFCYEKIHRFLKKCSIPKSACLLISFFPQSSERIYTTASIFKYKSFHNWDLDKVITSKMLTKKMLTFKNSVMDAFMSSKGYFMGVTTNKKYHA